MSTSDPAPVTSAETASARPEVTAAAHALARHGLVNAFGHVSSRQGGTIVITPPIALEQVRDDALLNLPLDAAKLPPGTPPEAWAHLAVYRARPDVRAVVRAMPPSAFAVGVISDTMPVLHGQSSWLGGAVPIHSDSRLLRTVELATPMAAALGAEHAIIFRGNGALTTGDSPGMAMARMHLLEAACRVWLQATASGTPRPMPTESIAAWQATTDQLLPRLWEHLRTSGESAQSNACERCVTTS